MGGIVLSGGLLYWKDGTGQYWYENRNGYVIYRKPNGWRLCNPEGMAQYIRDELATDRFSSENWKRSNWSYIQLATDRFSSENWKRSSHPPANEWYCVLGI